jgi:hypothetical protein
MLIAERTDLHLRLFDLTLKNECSLEGIQQIKEREHSGCVCDLGRPKTILRFAAASERMGSH